MLLLLLSLAVTPLIVLAVSAVVPLSYLLIKRAGTGAKKPVRTAILLFAALIVFHAGLCVLIANRPIVVCPTAYRTYMDNERTEQLRNDVKGLYPTPGLLFPGVIQVEYADETALRVHVQYLFYGTVDFAVDSEGVKGIEKPLY